MKRQKGYTKQELIFWIVIALMFGAWCMAMMSLPCIWLPEGCVR